MTEKTRKTQTTGSDKNWLAGGGEMAKVVAMKDWSKTHLGPIESWPQSLRTTVSLCLASNFPISIAWGPQRVQIYNDGYWPICAAKHPQSMGQDFKECWLSAWPVIGKAFEEASNGETRFLINQRMFLDRLGFLEETFFTFSFSPIRDESGGVGGLFHPVTELTQQSLAERRLRVLRDVADWNAKATSVEGALTVIADTLAENALDVPFALFYRTDADGASARLVRAVGMEPGSDLSPPTLTLEPSPNLTWPLGQALDSGKPVVLNKLAQRFGTLRCGPYEEPPNTAIVQPIVLPGVTHPFGFLVSGVSARRPLDDPYRTFYDMLGEAVTNALTKARAYEAERARAEALAELDRAKTVFFSNVSHEFRTPLTLMLGPVEDMLAKNYTELSPAAKGQLEIVSRNGLRLLRLVNTLMDFSRLQAGRVQASYVATDLAAFTAELASCFRSATERAGLRLIIDCPPLSEPVYVDRDMWEKIVLNLLSNAVKFTVEGQIEVSLREVDSGQWAVDSAKETEQSGFGQVKERRTENAGGELSGTQGVAEGGDLSGTVLSSNQGVSKGGAIRPHESDPPRRHVGSGEHRGGSGEGVHQGVPQLSEHRPGLSERIGNSSASQSAGGAAQTGDAESAAGDGGRNQPNVVGASKGAEKSQVTEGSGEWTVGSGQTARGSDDSALSTHHSTLPNDPSAALHLPLSTPHSPLPTTTPLPTTHSPLHTTRSVILRVRDSGVGIPAEELPRIFERFHRVQNMRSRTYEGTGIGLALVQELIKLHGGSIRADSTIDQGSVFIVTMPLGTAHLPANQIDRRDNEASTAMGAAPFVAEALRWLPEEVVSGEWRVASHEQEVELTTRARVLVVDDNADMRQYITRILSERYSVKAASDGEAALASARDRQPDLILSDVMMPKLDGFGLLRELRGDPATKTIPVILLSARAGEESRIEGLEQGADDYLIKPFSARELLARVAAHLAMARVRREAQAEIARSKLFLERIATSSPDLLFVYDIVERRNLYINRRVESVLGYTAEEFQTFPDLISAVVHPDDMAGLETWFSRFDGAADDEILEHEHRLCRHDGSYRWLYVRASLFERTAGGGARQIIGVASDITERKQAEESLRQSEALYRAIGESIEYGVWVCGPDGRNTYASDSFLKLVGLTQEQCSDFGWSNVLHPDDAEATIAAWNTCVQTGGIWDREHRFLGVDGQWHHILARGVPVKDEQGGITSWAGINLDISRLKRSEELLRASEAWFHTLADTISQFAWMADAAGWIFWYNRRWYEYSGTTLEEMQGWGWEKIHHPDYLDDVLTSWRRAHATGEPWEETFPLRGKDGTYRWFLSRAMPIRDAEGKVIRWFGTNTDVTEQRETEAALRESEERYRTTFANAAVGIAHVGLDGRWLVVNDAVCRITGYEREELLLKPFADITHPDDLEREWANARRLLAGETSTYSMDKRYIRKEGGLTWIHLTVSLQRDESGSPNNFICVIEDITERKRAEQALRESEEQLRSFSGQLELLVQERTEELVQIQDRLRALATELNLAEQRERKRLAGELHDYLAQLLVVCRLNLGQVRRAGLPPKGEEIVKETEEVLNQALNYSRTLMAELSPPVLQEHGLSAGLKWLGEQMQRHGLAVTVDSKDAADVSLSEDYTVLLFQSVRELLINALKHAGSKEVAVCLDQADGKLRIEVRDNGVGFDLAAAAAAASNGTTAMSSKFGLFSIRERMRALGGWFHIVSEPGLGTTAILALPLAAKPQRGAKEVSSGQWGVVSGGQSESDERRVTSDKRSSDHSGLTTRHSPLSTSSGHSPLPTPHSPLQKGTKRIRVLLVDDHAMVRQGLRSVLDSYDDIEVVGEAWNGEEAVGFVETLRPTLVVMDINMPKMNGIEATAKIKARFPDTLIIGLSVNAGGENQERMIEAGASMLFTKEAAVDELYRAIQNTLQRK